MGVIAGEPRSLRREPFHLVILPGQLPADHGHGYHAHCIQLTKEPGQFETITQLLASLADQALYHAKETGRNKMVRASDLAVAG